MKTPSGSPIIQVATRGLVPVIQIIGLYVFFHGHYSPGGGFQGGVLLAASILLARLSLGTEVSQLLFPARKTIIFSALGALIFAGTGLTALLAGGQFLNYEFLPLPGLEPAALRNWGILIIESGVTITVMTSLIAIYDEIIGC
jgi:multicomponent Na+:H+ antiporter subunit B